MSNILRLIVENLMKTIERSIEEGKSDVFTSAGEAKVNNISAADPDAGAGVADVACVRDAISLKTGLRLAVAVRRNKRAVAITICRKGRNLC